MLPFSCWCVLCTRSEDVDINPIDPDVNDVFYMNTVKPLIVYTVLEGQGWVIATRLVPTPSTATGRGRLYDVWRVGGELRVDVPRQPDGRFSDDQPSCAPIRVASTNATSPPPPTSSVTSTRQSVYTLAKRATWSAARRLGA